MFKTAIGLALTLVLTLAATPALAKAASARAAAAAVAVPDQPWYPKGYRDLRIAAAETVRIFPRDPQAVLNDFGDRVDQGYKTYDVIDCSLGYDLPNATDDRQGWQELLALDVARMRGELRGLGYRPEIYDRPLLDHERASLAHFAVVKPRPAQTVSDDASSPPAADAAITEDEDAYYDSFWGLDTLAKTMEARRKRLQPRKPRLVADGGCGGGEAEFTVALSPPTGRLWLINAFAFKVCERKVRDPWDHVACGWNDYASGDKTIASGRYMYEARWPGGAVRRGAKVLDETEDGAAIVIRRD